MTYCVCNSGHYIDECVEGDPYSSKVKTCSETLYEEEIYHFNETNTLNPKCSDLTATVSFPPNVCSKVTILG